MTTALAADRYLTLVDSDTSRLLELAERGVDVPVPSCPGWTVADLVDHLAHVYEHKVRVMAANAWPEDWPPEEYAGREPIGFLHEAKEHLSAEFARHRPTDPATTFGADDTVMFWMRRMALEVAVHRVDAELAHGEVTPVDPALALDGIDEFLLVMLAGDWDGETEHPVDAVAAVEAGGLRWCAEISELSVAVAAAPRERAAVTISGDPAAVFLWLWGRPGADAVHQSGDRAVLADLRGRLAEAAQ